MTTATLVIDASAALFMAAAGVRLAAIGDYDLVAPPTSVRADLSVVQAALPRRTSGADRSALFMRLEALPVRIVDDGSAHRREAFDLARSLGWAKTYDAEYVVLARRLGCALLTTDARLERGAQRMVEVMRPTAL